MVLLPDIHTLLRNTLSLFHLRPQKGSDHLSRQIRRPDIYRLKILLLTGCLKTTAFAQPDKIASSKNGAIAMRGIDVQPRNLFSYIQPEQRVPMNHPPRSICQSVCNFQEPCFKPEYITKNIRYHKIQISY